MAHPHWPLFDLVIRTPRLELRMPTEAELAELATLAAGGVHDPSFQPFNVPWTDLPPPERARSVMQWHWRCLGNWSPDDWDYHPVVIVDGAVVGTQGVSASRFADLGVVSTGSWLGLPHQGRGIGKEMRAAVLHLAFAGLGAAEAVSAYYEDNGSSKGVSQALGYEPNGRRIELRRGESAVQMHVRMPRAAWAARARDDIEITGLEPCLELFGAGERAVRPSG